MSLARPLVTVYENGQANKYAKTVPLPTVMQTPLRPDLVNFVHYNLLRNHRQAYGVKENAGYETSAKSWGTGRAVSRIPRVLGGGTHRSGQAAFGNMCRGGGMFSPTKTWRRWHRHVNVTQRRHAVASAIAGSAYTALVLGRGHRIEQVPELPLVITDDAESLKKTRDAVSLLQKVGCSDELKKVTDSIKIRTGKGKARNRRYVSRKGPLIVYTKDDGIVKACANIPGVDTANIERLNLLQLAPGGVVGRFIIWTESAFKRLQEIYGDYTIGAPAGIKSGYNKLREVLSNADITRIINSNEIQTVVRQAVNGNKKALKNRNHLKNRASRCKIDPAYKFRVSNNQKKKKTLEQ